MTRRPDHRGGVVLLAVMVIVVIAVLSATTLIHRAGSELAAAQATLRRTQARAGAWSGVQGVMAELAGQREAMLAGGVPTVTGEWYLGDDAGPRTRVRLLGTPDLVESEAGKLDVNAATEGMLAKLRGLGPELAAAIVRERSGGRFASVDDLLRVEGVTLAMLDEAGVSGEEDAGVPALRSLVTAGSFDPDVQCGLGQRGRDHAGLKRINLNLPWSDSLSRAIDDRFGTGASAGVKTIFDEGNRFGSRRDIASFMRRRALPAELFGEILDAFTCNADLFSPGLVDLNRAPVEVLACIPGIDETAAAEIVMRRDALDDEQRQSVAWPLELGILSPEGFEEAADHVTTRTLQWRVVVESGIVGEGLSPDGRWPDIEEARDRVVLEAVIDLGSSRPRVAYLRDITMLDTARDLRRRAQPATEPDPIGEPTVIEIGVGPPPEDGGFGEGLFAPRPEEPDPDIVEDSESPDPDEVGAEPPMEEAEPGPPDGAVDNRSGRWTTGGPS